MVKQKNSLKEKTQELEIEPNVGEKLPENQEVTQKDEVVVKETIVQPLELTPTQKAYILQNPWKAKLKGFIR